MKIFDWFRRTYERLKLKNIAIAAVLITQAIKRFANSEIGQLVIDMSLLKWPNFIGKVLGILYKTNEVLPMVVKSIVVSKGILDEAAASDDKIAIAVLVDHLRYYSKKDLSEFSAFMALQILNARAGDGIIDEEEKKEIIEATYQFLFKDKK